MEFKPVRVRFAPSPTGPLHIGGIRTALYNYLFARKHGGSFLLRIEDTDRNRLVPGAEAYLFESLNWCGISPDEGPEQDGKTGPYRQSERRALYRAYADRLVENGHAYYAFDTAEELDQMRERLRQAGSDQLQYDSSTRLTMQNSLTLSAGETRQRMESGNGYVIRAKIPFDEIIVFTDLIRGEVSVHSSQLDDKVLFKSDDWPTYHLANVVDDYLMKISHVIRGEEWLPSAPLHVLLYRFFGWENEMPQFAHLPLILKPDGNGKLSKRDGDRLGFPVFPLNWKDPVSGAVSAGFRERGFFPGALMNFLALLGWHPTGDTEIFSMEELISQFSLEHIHKSGARFDFEKATWYNHQYMEKMSGQDLATRFLPFLKEKNVAAAEPYVSAVCDVLKHRVNFIAEFWEKGSFFFIRPESYDTGIVKGKWNENSRKNMDLLMKELEDQTDFAAEAIDRFLQEFLKSQQIKAGDFLPLLRVALIGTKNGPSVFEILSILGKTESLERLKIVMVKFDLLKAS